MKLKDVKSHFNRAKSEMKSRMEHCLSASAIKGVLDKNEKQKKIMMKRKFLNKRRLEEEQKFHTATFDVQTTLPSARGLIRAED